METTTSTGGINVEVVQEEMTLEKLAAKVDHLGSQMNWLCENLESLFGFVSQMGASGGGLRGMLKLLSNGNAPEMSLRQGDNNDA